MEEVIQLNKKISLYQISEQTYYLFDRRTKKSYEIGKREAETMETLRGIDNFDTLCKKNAQRMSREQLCAFCKQLGKLGFLEGTKTKSSQRLTRLKLGFLNPSKHLSAHSPFIVFFRWFILYAPIVVTALAIVSFLFTGGQNIIEALTTFELRFSNIVFAIVTFFAITAIHEIGHMALAIYNGVPVAEMGVMLYWFFPAAYADVSAIYFIEDKRKKINILMGGVYSHITWTVLGIFIFNLFPRLNNLTVPFIAVNIALIFANVTFYLKLDGYYILTILLDEPMLRENAIRFVVDKNYRKQLHSLEEANLSMTFAFVAFVSLLYIPAIILSLVFRFLPQLLTFFD